MYWITLSLLLLVGCTTAVYREEARDVLEGDDITLKCSFKDARVLSDDNALYWMRTRQDETDNAAIGHQALDSNYRVTLNEEESSYELTINRATYERDNGVFECRVKEGSGSVLHSTIVNLTVLIPPGSPQISPPKPQAIEGKPLQLTCSSSGGSPDPQIIWYREGSDQKLRSVLKPGGKRDEATTSVLTINPTKDDHGNQYRCMVTSRALKEGEKMATVVRLDVDYYPRITIGPANPMRVEMGNPATLTCDVDAKPPVQNVRWMRNGRVIDVRPTLHINSATEEEAGRYICQADNGLGNLREREVTLDVLYGPTVLVPSSKDLDEGEDLVVVCNVTANPAPGSIQWLKQDDPSFRQSGDILRINRVTAANQGNYICRAVNFLAPTNGDGSDRIGNATVAVRIRHSPGKSFIKLSKDVAVSGEPITLTCGSNPPGWPIPSYEWRRLDTDKPLLIGSEYTIPQASFSDEGFYSCQPANRLGKGSKASISLKVFQAPSILEHLPETKIESIATPDVSLTCRAQGKPEPSVHWFKDGEEIIPAEGLFDSTVQQSAVGSNGVYTVQSKLMFNGPKRINNNQVIAQDRGIYECRFSNEVRDIGTSMFLRVEHSPITVHKENKVAFNVGEDATLGCLMQAFPNPSFQWYRGSSIVSKNNARYSINDTSMQEDVYSSQLTIFDLTSDDYGDYTCKGENNIGDHKTIIKLQPKSKPEAPYDLNLVASGTDNVEIAWIEGFNGGYSDTKFMAEVYSEEGARNEYDCQRNIPCMIMNLNQQSVYTISVRAYNTEGNSEYSERIEVSTGVEAASIPVPFEVFFEKLNEVAVFKYENTDLLLVGEVKKVPEGGDEWEVVSSGIPLRNSDLVEVPVNEISPEKVQVRICAFGEESLCSSFIEAKIVDVLPMRVGSSAYIQNTVGIIVACVVVFAIFCVFLICCCKRKQRNIAKAKKKAAQMDVASRGVSQAPPPPYYTVGRENKAMDAANGSDDISKPALYGPQQPFTYGPTTGILSSQQNMGGYVENSYSNSNNGGSVNSQDSLWQVKNGGAFDPSTTSSQPSQMSPTNAYNYEPMVDSYGISGYGDYSPYPQNNPGQMPPPQQPQQVPMMDKTDGYFPVPTQGGYLANNGDPYASVQKNRKRMDPMDAYDVSGMPDPYMDQHQQPMDPSMQMQGQMLPPHDPNMAAQYPNHPQDPNHKPPQISFDESLESGYSTPNSRNRRIIREIIV